ncbi:MAG: hypothetical protein ACLTT1_01805 [[Clostridium] scindens]
MMQSKDINDKMLTGMALLQWRGLFNEMDIAMPSLGEHTRALRTTSKSADCRCRLNNEEGNAG